MLKIYILFSTMLLTNWSLAQVVLYASMSPDPGTKFIYYDANVPNPAFSFGKQGKVNTWDFTAITPLPTIYDTVFVSDPTTIPGAMGAFPSGTHAIREHDSPEYTVLEIDDTGVKMLGIAGDLYGTGTVLVGTIEPAITSMTFPYSFGSKEVSTGKMVVFTTGKSIGEPTLDSVWLRRTITSEREVIAEGNLVIPGGNFPSILERSKRLVVDSAWVKGTATGGVWYPAAGYPLVVHDSAFNWYTRNTLFKYAHALYDETGLHDVVFHKETITGIAEQDPDDDWSIYPNPAGEVLELMWPHNMGTKNEILITDVFGKTVMQETGKPSHLNIARLKPGVYVLTINGSQGPNLTRRFIRQ